MLSKEQQRFHVHTDKDNRIKRLIISKVIWKMKTFKIGSDIAKNDREKMWTYWDLK